MHVVADMFRLWHAANHPAFARYGFDGLNHGEEWQHGIKILLHGVIGYQNAQLQTLAERMEIWRKLWMRQAGQQLPAAWYLCISVRG